MRRLPPPPFDLLDGAALFLDFDGTLVELAETPAAIRIPPALGSLLAALKRRLEGRLAIVSGRSIADLESHLDCSGLAIAGSHGLELRFAEGKGIAPGVPARLAVMTESARAFAESAEGLLLEAKPAGLALHYRQAPDEADRVRRFMGRLAADHDMLVQHGNLVVELRPPGATKGDALRSLMAEPPFAGARPVFVGDDLTDEHAFEAASSLGGAGVLVGAARPTAAAYRLADVASVADWLGRSK